VKCYGASVQFQAHKTSVDRKIAPSVRAASDVSSGVGGGVQGVQAHTHKNFDLSKNFFANVFTNFCPDLHGFCPNFQKFCPNFHQIKTFEGALALPAPPPPTPLWLAADWY